MSLGVPTRSPSKRGFIVKNPEAISHWYLLIENFETSALDFYAAVEQALRERQIPNLALSRVTFQ